MSPVSKKRSGLGPLPMVFGVLMVTFIVVAAWYQLHVWRVNRAIEAILAAHGKATLGLVSVRLSHGDEELNSLLKLLIAARGPNTLHLVKRVSDDSMPLVGQMIWLHSLLLDSPAVTDKGLSHLTGLQEILYLSLSGGSMTDNGLVFVAKLQSLEKLRLRGLKITDDGIQVLAALPRLRELSISKTNVTAEGLERLMRKLPSLNNPDMQRRITRMRQKAAE